MRTDDILKLLRRRGEKGVSSQDIADKCGFSRIGSSSKVISQLRAIGHNIEYDKERSLYVLNKKSDPAEEVIPEDAGEFQLTPDDDLPITEDTTVDPTDAIFFKISGKKDKIREFLLRAGAKGASPRELSKCSGVMLKNICYHIHSLRKSGEKITLKEGKYIIRANRRNPLYDKGTGDLPDSDIPVEVVELLGDKRLINSISKVHPEDLPVYMEHLRKVIYYTKCALAIIETNELLETLTIGDGR
jgi:biotin operon repressor